MPILPEHLEDLLAPILALPELGVAVLAESFTPADRRDPAALLACSYRLSAFSRRLPPCDGVRRRIGHRDGPVWGMSLYLVTRRACRALAANASDGGRPWWIADDFWLHETQAGVDVQVVRPALGTCLGEDSATRIDGAAPQETTPASPSSLSRLDRLRSRLALRTRWRGLRQTTRASLGDLRRWPRPR